MESPDEITLEVQAMTCASCVAHVQKAAMSVPGVEDCRVNLAAGKAVVRLNLAKTTPQAVAQAITDSGYPSTVPGDNTNRAHAHDHSEIWFRRAWVAIALW